MSLQQISSNLISVHFFVLLLEGIQCNLLHSYKASATMRKDINVRRNMCKKSCKKLTATTKLGSSHLLLETEQVFEVLF